MAPTVSIEDHCLGSVTTHFDTLSGVADHCPSSADARRMGIRVSDPLQQSSGGDPRGPGGRLVPENTSGGDIAIGETGEVVPDGSYATYLIDEVHMDPDPLRFDPARYLGKADVKQETQGYVGWGSGLHPCREYSRLVLFYYCCY